MIKTFFSELFTYLMLPTLLTLHYITGHGAFTFIYGAFNVIAMVSVGLALYAVIAKSSDAKVMNGFIKSAHKIKRWKFALGMTMNVCALAYLLYASSFFVASILLINIFLIASFYSMLWSLRKFTPLDESN